MRKLSFAACVIALPVLLEFTGASGALAQQANPAPAPRPAAASAQRRPVLFVHGAQGSGAQFQSQALRFASNGYPPQLIRAFDFDSTMTQQTMPQILAGIDAAIAELQMQTGSQQVDLVGHSLGTFVSMSYLSTPARAAKVAHYVNADGGTATALPGGVPTTALFAGAARGANPGQIVGATNVVLPDQTHIEAVSSAAAFREMFRLFTGTDPTTTDIVPTTTPTVAVSGRAVINARNVGVAGATLQVFALDPATGARPTDASGAEMPVARIPIDATGNFGPVSVRRGAPLEFVLVRSGMLPHSFFMEPPVRDDTFIRLTTTDLTPADVMGRSANSVLLTLVRQKEFRGELTPDPDVLTINGTNIINAVTAPCCQVGRAPASITLTDAGDDRMSNIGTAPAGVRNQGFATVGDLFIAANPRTPIAIRLVPRGNNAAARTLNIPARAASQARMNVLFDEAR